jgi:hypothetical protein
MRAVVHLMPDELWELFERIGTGTVFATGW